MAITLAEAAKLSQDVLLKGVIETIIKDSPILQKLPFIDIEGNSLTYNRVTTYPTAKWHAPNEEWTAGTEPAFTQETAVLTILGIDADVDNYIKQTRSNVQDIEAAVVELKSRAVRYEFEDKFINGDGLNNTFEGIDALCASGQTISMGDNGGTLSLAKLDELIDLIKGGKPDMLLVSRRSRRKLTSLMRALGSIEVGQDEFGNQVQFYDGIQVAVNDWISDSQQVGASTDCSTIYALQFGEGNLAGLQNKGIQVERIGSLESYDATRTRIKWYVSLALFCELKMAKLIGVRD